MNLIEETITVRAIKFAGAITIAAVIFSGCSSDKVLTERAYIPSPAEQPPPGAVTPLPPAPTTPPTTITTPTTSEIPPFPEPKIEPIIYTVVKGDSLWKIARAYGVSVQELAVYNNISTNKVLKVGEKIKIPPGGAPVPPEKLQAVKSSPTKKNQTQTKTTTEPLPSDGIYVVKNGDSLWKIARKFNTTTDKIAAANNLDPKTPLQVGQKLKIPSASAPTPTTTAKESTKTGAPSATEKLPAKESPKTQIKTQPAEDFSELFGEEPQTTNLDQSTKSTPKPAEIKSTLNLEGTYHDVEAGDTWESIAKQYDVNVNDLKKANPAASAAGQPQPGTKVIIPLSF